MWFQGLVLAVVGGALIGLTAVPGVRHRQVQRFARRMTVPVGRHGHAMDERSRRRGTGAGVGLMAAGALVLVAWSVSRAPSVDPLVLIFLACAAMTCGVAVVEIWRPGSPPPGEARTARATVPGLSDYLPPTMIAGTWVTVASASVVVGGGLLLMTSPWFDTDVILGGPLPVLAVTLPVLTVLTLVAVRRVLATPEPARDDAELYWQDAVRAATLSLLHLPAALLGIVAMLVAGAALDDAATAAAVAQGAIGPDWVAGLLLGLYVVAGPGLVLVFVGTALFAQQETSRFRVRLWHGRAPYGVIA